MDIKLEGFTEEEIYTVLKKKKLKALTKYFLNFVRQENLTM